MLLNFSIRDEYVKSLLIVTCLLYCGCRNFNNPLDSNRTDGLPPVPTDFRVIASTYRSVTLGFSYAYKNSYGIIVYRNSIPHDTITNVTTYTDSMQVKPMTHYIYKLRCYNKNGLTESTTALSVLTPQVLDPSDIYGGINIQASIEDTKFCSSIEAKLTSLKLNTKPLFIKLDTTGNAKSGFVLEPGFYVIETHRHGFLTAFDTVSISAGAITNTDTIVLKDIFPPTLTELKDTTISIFDAIDFLGPTDSFYTICTLTHTITEEKSGNIIYSYSGATRDTIVHFPVPGNYLSTRTAIDIHGNVSTDSSHLTVDIDLPVANAGSDTVITWSSDLFLKGSKSYDKLGRIVKYEWDIGSTGTFITVADGDTTIKTTDSITICILRVTDDDGGTDTAQIQITRVPYLAEVVSGNNYSFSTTGHTCEVFDDKIWFIGGQNKYASINNNPVVDVPKYSSDGINWNSASNASIARRWGHSSLVFNDKLFIIGGFDQEKLFHNDIICCNKDYQWVKLFVSPGFIIPKGHVSIVFKEKIWIFGGGSNNIYTSIDGSNWVLQGENPIIHGRSNCSIVEYKDKLWIIGGESREDVTDPLANGIVLDDIISSTDGLDWTSIKQSRTYFQRMDHESVVFDDKMWIIGGQNNNPNNWKTFNTMNSINGTSWKRITDSYGFSARFDFAAVTFQNKIFCFGGLSDSTVNSDVWILKK